MTRRTKVYVAGPITTSGNMLNNIHEAIHASMAVWDAGYAFYLPHSNCFMEIVVGHRDYDMWMEMDREWLLSCDVLLRLPGKSNGADQEVRWARRHQIPVVHSIEELEDNFPAKREAA